MFTFDCMDEALKCYCKAENIFDVFRLVDPEEHTVFNLVNGSLERIHGYCYEIWGRTMPCKNCITGHACRENRQFIKMDQNDHDIYLVISVPVEIKGKKYGLELAKNVIGHMMVTDQQEHYNVEITHVIAEFNEIVVRDMFTGLYNKTFMIDQIHNYIKEICNKKTAYWGILMDIDNFKSVNDVYGHYMGDVVIKSIAKTLKKYNDTENTWAVRMGGDEFFVMFKDCNKDYALSQCDELEKEISALKFNLYDKPFSVKVSIGLARLLPNDTMKMFVDRLDSNLYEEKKLKKGL